MTMSNHSVQASPTPGHLRRLPNFEQLSAVSATLMLAYVLGEFISIPSWSTTINALGILVEININTQLINAILTSGLAVTGTNWLLSTQDSSKVRAAQHWALPGLTAWVLSITLAAIPAGVAWWVTLILGTLFIVTVWIAEFITANPKDYNFRIAASGLTALAFALYLALTINLRAIQTRLIFLIPATSIPVILITVRHLVLRLQSQDLLDSTNRTTSVLAAFTIGALAGQIATSMHFLPISALSFGLALIAPIYSANILLGNLVDNRPKNRTVYEPVVILSLLWLSAFWLR